MKAEAVRKQGFLAYAAANRWLYILLLPGMIYLLVFNYVPIYGILIAFKKFSLVRGILASPWVGFENFDALFGSIHFFRVLRNSLLISSLRLVWGFPVPVILAILLNEVRHRGYKSAVQTIVYVPHFISWVVIIGIVMNFFSPEGAVNWVLRLLGLDAVNFLIEPRYFRGIVVATEIWKEAGWGTIIYLAAISSVDPQLYEAAIVDGASRLRRIWHITLPGILSTVVVLLILRLGLILDNGFEQIFLLYNSLTLDVADVFETFAYRTGLQEGRFAFATAVGLLKSTVGLALILSTNALARRLRETALW